MKSIKETIHAQGIEIGIYTTDFENEFISLTDIARYKSDEPAAVIQNWMRNRDVIEFLGLWETLHNTDFNHLEFEGFKNAAGANAFTMSPQKWIKATNAIGVVSKSGRYGGGTFAHSDIAMEFASWISAEFRTLKIELQNTYRRNKAESYFGGTYTTAEVFCICRRGRCFECCFVWSNCKTMARSESWTKRKYSGLYRFASSFGSGKFGKLQCDSH